MTSHPADAESASLADVVEHIARGHAAVHEALQHLSSRADLASEGAEAQREVNQRIIDLVQSLSTEQKRLTKQVEDLSTKLSGVTGVLNRHLRGHDQGQPAP